jgi:hypothetical protein
MAKTTELEAAYRATSYRVFLPGGCCELHIDQASENLRCWLETAGASEFVVLTAHNPGSQKLGMEANMERQSAMEVFLLENNYEPYAGENVADDASWPAEEICFVTDLGLADAKALGAKFGQNAIVHGVADGIPRLVWIEETE